MPGVASQVDRPAVRRVVCGNLSREYRRDHSLPEKQHLPARGRQRHHRRNQLRARVRNRRCRRCPVRRLPSRDRSDLSQYMQEIPQLKIH